MSDGYRTICADPPWTPTLGATWTGRGQVKQLVVVAGSVVDECKEER
jgi:DNA-binding protein H-NS